MVASHSPSTFSTLIDGVIPMECWWWRGYRDKAGYGSLSYQGKIWKAHRLAWTLLNGPIPDGLTIDHRCRNTSCCNVGHLRLLTPGENAADAVAHSRSDECPAGHNDWKYRSNGHRRCRPCEAAQYKRWMPRRKSRRIG